MDFDKVITKCPQWVIWITVREENELVIKLTDGGDPDLLQDFYLQMYLYQD